LVRSRHGGNGNFEVVVPRVGGGLDHWWRDNDSPAKPWHGPTITFGSTQNQAGAGLIQSNMGGGNLEVVFREGVKLTHCWRDDNGSGHWKARTTFGDGAALQGSPSFVQGKSGGVGNFEVVSPLAGGGIGHWWRDNDHASLPWHGPTGFGGGAVDAVSLAQTSGGLELVARIGTTLVHFFRDGGGTWHGPSGPFASDVIGQPTFIQAANGNFEVVSPLLTGGIGHWWRDNSDPALAWHGPGQFGAGSALTTALATALIELPNGNLEVVAWFGDHLEHFSRGTSGWSDATVFGKEITLLPALAGRCTIPYETGCVGIHTVLLRTGRVLLWSFADFDAGHGESRVLDPVAGTNVTPAGGAHHIFCSGHAVASDGTVVVSGGDQTDIDEIHTFDPQAEKWQVVDHMAMGRWYPTVTALPDGHVLMMSGTVQGGPITTGVVVNDTIEQFHPASGVEPMGNAPSPFSATFPGHLTTIDIYPFVHVLPSGKLSVHSRRVTRFYDWESRTWDPTEVVTNHGFSRTYPCEGTSVLLPLRPETGYKAEILLIGGSGVDPEFDGQFVPATNTVELLDVDASPLQWKVVAPMTIGRVMPDAVLLADGMVCVVGGSSHGKTDGIDPAFPIELFDPKTDSWRTLCNTRVPRLYHSAALLLPDARVLMMGKDALNAFAPYTYPEHRAELFEPPYLFRGTRPTITSGPGEVHYGQDFAIGFEGTLKAVNLVRPGSVTHSFNMEQRLVGLKIKSETATSAVVEGPPNKNIAPPGHYMLFAIDNNGAPSVAKFVLVG